MRIGILTWYFAFNYGARAHSLALYNTLVEMGHEVELINFPSKRSFRMAMNTCTQFENRKKHPLVLARCMRKMVRFYIQRGQYHTSRIVRNAAEIDSLRYDLIICGSDEVLNQKHKLYNDLYYGVGLKTPKMMYATSAGVVTPETLLSSQINKSLQEMKAIGVRDLTTQQLIAYNTSLEPQLVLDPTWLYEFPKMARKHCEPYILVYSFGKLDEYSAQIRQYAAEKSWKIYCVGRLCKWADKSFISADLNEWLEMYQYAELVVTDSYHGFIFALKNEKEYVLIKRSDKTNKTDGLIVFLDIPRTYLSEKDTLSKYLKEPINYALLRGRIEERRKDSIEFLTNTISEVK